MKKSVFFIFGMIVFLFISNSCSRSEKNSVEDILRTATLELSTLPSPLPTSGTQEAPALVKISMEFYRNGKTYEIVAGYDLGQAFFRSTPFPEVPDKAKEFRISGADLDWYGDLDNDGELEFVVLLLDCGSYCIESLRIYEYDPKIDNYYVADEINSGIEAYEDIDQDGNLELITDNFGFCFQCNHATRALTALSILRYEQGKFIDVSREFPELLEQEAEHFLESSKTNVDNQGAGFITLASYLYDMYRLGKLEEGRIQFDKICISVIESSMSSVFDCETYRIEVEKAIEQQEK